jgi:fructose-bisphosphate aldolase, class II
MHGLRDALEQSQKDGVAIGHFNVGDWVLLKAVLAAGQELKVPVVVGASEGEREFIGVRQIAALVRSLQEECGLPNLSQRGSYPFAGEGR